MSRADERKRANDLKATKARDLINATVPYVLNAMTEAQIDQVQRVLDAAAVNPWVERSAANVYRDASREKVIEVNDEKHSYLKYADPRVESRVQHAKDWLIPVNKADKHIRLDYRKLLTSDALQPKTDNPDEAMYLLDVVDLLDARGVWFRFEPELVPDPEHAADWIPDTKMFDAWLTLGDGNDKFRSGAGQLNRDSVYDNMTLGALRYDRVWEGPVYKSLTKAIEHLQREVQAGQSRHLEIAHIRRTNKPGVTYVAEKRGGASYPDEDIWKPPWNLLLAARASLTDGKIARVNKLVILAAALTRNASKSLSDYIDAYISGGESTVRVLRVAKIAGEVAQAALMVHQAGVLAARYLAARAAVAAASRVAATVGERVAAGAAARTAVGEAAGATTGAAGARTGAAAATETRTAVNTGTKAAAEARAAAPPPVVRNEIALADTNVQVRRALTRTINRATDTLDTAALAGNATDRYALSIRERLDNFYQFMDKELKAAYARNGVRNVSIDELSAIYDRGAAQFGDPTTLLD
jgi:hypothetical protein